MDSLIKLLKGNARLSNEQLAVMLGVTPEEVAARIADYEKKGVIKGYSVILNEELADKNAVTAFIEVKVTPQRGIGFDKIAERISKFDEVKSVYLMSGGFDFTVILEEKTMKEIAQFVTSKLSTLDEVLNTATHFVLKKYKDYGVTMMEEHKDERMLVTP